MKQISRTIDSLIAEIISENPKPLVQDNHTFDYLLIGSATPAFFPLAIFLDFPPLPNETDTWEFPNPDRFYVHPGSVIPIKGKPVYVQAVGRAISSSHFFEYTYLRRHNIDFIFVTKEEASTYFLAEHAQGKKVMDINVTNQSIATGASNTIMTADGISPLYTAQPLYFKGILEGAHAPTGTAMPLELIIKEGPFNGQASLNLAPNAVVRSLDRAYLFPMYGGFNNANDVNLQRYRAFVQFPIGRNSIPGMDTNSKAIETSSRWSIVVKNNASTTRQFSMHGEICCGTVEEHMVYDFNRRVALGFDPATAIINQMGMTLGPRQGPLAISVVNLGGAAILNTIVNAYIDSVHGGPLVTQVEATIAVAAGAFATTPIVSRARHLYITQAWAAAPGAAAEFATSLVAGG